MSDTSSIVRRYSTAARTSSFVIACHSGIDSMSSEMSPTTVSISETIARPATAEQFRSDVQSFVCCQLPRVECVDRLDERFQWQSGSRSIVMPSSPPIQAAPLSASLTRPIIVMARWIGTPANSIDSLNAVAFV